MIVYDLCCDIGHRFEGWFGSSDDYSDQTARGLISCPECGSVDVMKAPMAPAVSAKSNQNKTIPESSRQISADAKEPMTNTPVPVEVEKAISKLAELQAKALKDSTYVGKDFVEKSRAMHYGEVDQAAIHGEASLKDAKDLIDEGVGVAPLPFPVAPPEDLN